MQLLRKREMTCMYLRPRHPPAMTPRWRMMPQHINTSISFDITLWKLEEQSWVKLDEWDLQ